MGVVGRGGGIRTPTRGFGDRWSAVKPTPLYDPPNGWGAVLILLDFLVTLVLAAMAAELLHFQPLRRGLLVLRRRIVPVLALCALERNDIARHIRLLLYNLGYRAGADRAAAFANREAQ